MLSEMVESSRTSLASRTQFKVLGLEGQVLGLEVCKSSICPVLGSRIALFFDLLKMGQGYEQCYFILDPKHARERAKQNFEDLFWENACIV